MQDEQIQINLGDRPVMITLVRSRTRRRSIAMMVHKDGQVSLRAPHRTSTADLVRFANRKAVWLADKLKKFEMQQAAPARPDNIIRVMGREYLLHIEKSALLRKRGFCEMIDDVMHVHVPAKLTAAKIKTAVHHALEIWYKKTAAEVFASRAAHFAPLIGVQYQAIKLADPRARWGSCDKSGKLMFSWRAVMLPPELIDYLIVHELCHLVHFDHSKAYWQTVAAILPDYKKLRMQLRDCESLTDLKI